MRAPFALKILWGFLVLAVVASLGSCGVLSFIFSTPFPQTTVLAKAQADLSGVISSSNADSFNLKTVATGGYEYVILMGPSGSVAYVYDTDLNLKKTLTNIGGTGSGNGVMADANGNIVLGSTQLAPDLSSSSSLTSGITVFSAGSTGVDGFATSPTSQITDFGINSNTLNYTSFPYPWSLPGTNGSVALSAYLSNLTIEGIFDDGSAGTVTFVVGPSGNNQSTTTAYFFTVNKASFPFTANVVDSSPSRDHIVADSIGYAQGSIFAYDTSSSSLVQINPSNGSIKNSFFSPTNDPSQTRFAYRASGGSFYGFNTKSRILTKYAAWW